VVVAGGAMFVSAHQGTIPPSSPATTAGRS
jgi:hypothetical protein